MSRAARDRVAPLFVADALYLAAVYAFFLAIPPLGRDYAALARPDTIPFFRGMVRLFGNYSCAYLLMNLVLLYGCMALILAITRRLSGGPWWLGSVAAVLFMANPVKTEAVLNISGVRELWPGIMALLTLYVYMRCRHSERRGARWLTLIMYLTAILTGPINIMLFAVLIVLEYIVRRQPKAVATCRFQPSAFSLQPSSSQNPESKSRLWIPIAAVGAIALFMSFQWAMPGALHPARMFAPLFFVTYPIGMLPDTVAFFQNWPVAGYVIGVAVFIFGIRLIRKVNNPAFSFGLLGAAAFRLCQGGFTVDAVTLAGGGQLLLPTALLCIALAGFFHTVLCNAEWRKSVVRITTLLCVAAMCCQIWVNLHWRHAGGEVRRFQDAVAAATRDTPGAPGALVPAIQYYRTAPMMLYESVKYHTPFSTRQPVTPLLPFSVIPPVDIKVKYYSPESIIVLVQGLAAPETAKPRRFSREWWLHRYRPHPPVPLRLEAREHPFPDTWVDLRP